MKRSIHPWLTAITLCCVMLARPAAAADSPATATAPALPEPTRITLTLEDVPVADALVRLLEAANLPADVPLDPNAQRMLEGVTISAAIVDQPIVLALIEICRQAGLEPIFTGQTHRPVTFIVRNPPTRVIPPRHAHAATRPVSTRPVSTRAATTSSTRPTPAPGLIPRGPVHRNTTWIDGPTIAAGPFVIVPGSATRTSSTNLETGESARELRLELIAIADPALRLFGRASHLAVEAATDDAGRPLLAPADPQQHIARPLERIAPMPNLIVPLRYPEHPRGTLATLRGQLNFTIVTRSEPVEIISDSKVIPGELTAGPVRFTIGPAQETGDGVQLPLKITHPFNGTDGWDEIRATARGDNFRVSDPSGAAYSVETHIHSVVSDSYQGTIHLRLPHDPRRRDRNPPKTPARVVWDVPSEVADLSVPVELENLPLP